MKLPLQCDKLWSGNACSHEVLNPQKTLRLTLLAAAIVACSCLSEFSSAFVDLTMLTDLKNEPAGHSVAGSLHAGSGLPLIIRIVLGSGACLAALIFIVELIGQEGSGDSNICLASLFFFSALYGVHFLHLPGVQITDTLYAKMTVLIALCSGAFLQYRRIKLDSPVESV